MRDLPRIVTFLSLVAFSVSSAPAADKASCNGSISCQIPENVVLQLPFPGIAGDVIIQEANSTTVSDVFRIFNNIVDTGAGTGFGNLAILYSRDDNMPLPDPSTYSANAVTITEAANGSTSYLGNGTTYSLDTAAVPTKLTYTGNTTADYHDPAQFTAVLTILATGVVIPGATINFTLGSQSCTATTNASGVASCGVVPNQAAGNYTVAASFGGIFGADAGTSSSAPFVITREEITLSYTGDTVIANGGTAHLSGVLLEDNITAIAGRMVNFTLGNGGSAQTCNGITDSSGRAACTINPVAQPLGPGVVGDNFPGDAFYRPASASASTTLFAFLTSGSFVLGDQSAQMGTPETFWGMQWARRNQLSGGPAPADFKGFAETLSSEPPKCGIGWTSRPGNSSQPPDSVPAYIGVLVSPLVLDSGSTLSGSAVGIVVMKTDPGYTSDPGHAGTGIVVAKFCP